MKKKYGDKDDHIEDLLKMDFGEKSEDSESKQTETEEMDVDEKSTPKSMKEQFSRMSAPKRFVMGWLLLTFVIPPPFGFIILKFNKVKLRWYHYLLLINIIGLGLLMFIVTFLFIPLQQQISVKHKINKTVIVQQGRAERDGYGLNPDGTLDMSAGSGSYNPNFSGGMEIDYDKLEQLYPGDKQAKAQAQRYQLILHVSKMFDIDPLTIYGFFYVETTLYLPQTDIYQEMHSSGEPGDKHSIGPGQVSQTPKHLAHAFESKYSTREGSPRNDAVMSVKAGMNWSDTAMKDGSTNPTDKLPSIHTVIDIDGGYSPDGQESEWASNIKGPSDTTRAYYDRLLKPGATSYGEDGGTAKYHLRPNPFYLPDVVYSLAYDLTWIVEDLTVAAKDIVNGGPGKLAQRSRTRKLQWSVEEAQKFLNMPRNFQVEVAYLYMCDWYLGSLTGGKGDSAFKLWQKLGIFGMQIIDKYGSICLEEEFENAELWARIDGRSNTGSKPLLYKGNSLVEEFGYYNIYADIESGGGGSSNWEAFTYGIRGVNGAYPIYQKEKAIFESVVIKDYNRPPDGSSSYGRIIDLQWSEAHKKFPRMDQGGPGEMNCIDVATGKEFTLLRTVGTNHADVEAKTKQDTAIIKSLLNGSDWKWTARAILIKGDKGELYAASMATDPHAGDTLDFIPDNDMYGVLDVHFRGSTRHMEGSAVADTTDDRHQAQIDIAMKATQYLSAKPPTAEGGFGPILDYDDVYPAIMGATITQSFKEHGSKAIDAQVRPWTNKEQYEGGGGKIFTQSVKPTVPIYNSVDGVVTRVKCHNPGKTGNPQPWDVSPKESSDHSKKTYNTWAPNNSGATYDEGDCVYVQGKDGRTYMYMHMYCGSVVVQENQQVKAGQILGYEGNTGVVGGTTGVHLHLQIQDGSGNYFDPTKFITMGQ